ncbi:hypothetical protein CVV38_03105 [Candidatus Peregrinibacteria bacterium HGW-Peregrinibacteria-1]|jgi:excinuclease ABC subunit C|nr:MAG: hypothetical protein CVV38_03105 [Candidatus Peregrinibacteria bacterium HGW-Peregrinibacteria-1]
MLDKKQIKELVSKAPHAPGIYKMIDQENLVIYIGKAKDLKKRLTQYFKPGYEHSTRTKKLLEKMKRVDITEVDSELESIILESNLIKQFRPKYNILLKDDKSFVYIRISKEQFPRIHVVRNPKKDKAKYIGPKTQAGTVKDTLKFLKKIFPYRHCALGIELIEDATPGKNKVIVTNKVIKYPCLDYYIKRCVGPCTGNTTIQEYQTIVAGVENFLLGKPGDIIAVLEKQMLAEATNKQFEKAAKTRDKITKIRDITEKQKVETFNDENQDIINYCIIQNKAYFNLFQIRSGKLIGQDNFILTAEEIEENTESPEVLEAFITQYYELSDSIPSEIIIPHPLENQKQIIEKMTLSADYKVSITVPQMGKKSKLLDMSLKNAQIYADRKKFNWQEESQLTEKAADSLQKILNIKTKLKRIECYDISHLSGTDTVASMVVFINGVPAKEHYRQFKLRTVKNKPDDFKSMEEVLYRRLLKIASTQHLKNLKLGKALKRDTPTLIENGFKIDQDGYTQLTYKDTTAENKIVAIIEFKNISEKNSQITKLWSTPENALQLQADLIRNATKKSKSNRFYIQFTPKEKEHLLKIGFEEIKKFSPHISDKLEDSDNTDPTNYLVYDKVKHREDASFSQNPDLIVIDGGKGQLKSATTVLNQLKLHDIPHISLAKRLEEIFIPNESASIILPKSEEALQLLQRARDEAHRFAITFNRKLRSKRITEG